MRLVLVPADAQVGSVIYRLRATDEEFDYPLTFEFVGDASSSTVKIESLPCTKYNSVCQANVILSRRLEPGRYYDFQVSVKDTKGGMATQLCSITATNFTTPHDLIFPHKPGIIMIPEVSLKYTVSICISPFFPISMHICHANVCVRVPFKANLHVVSYYLLLVALYYEKVTTKQIDVATMIIAIL